MNDMLLNFVISFLITVICYMSFPMLRLLIHGEKFERKRANRIALWNSVVVGILFCIGTIAIADSGTTWSAGPAFLYYFINRAILRKNDEDQENEGVELRPEVNPSVQYEIRQPDTKSARKETDVARNHNGVLVFAIIATITLVISVALNFVQFSIHTEKASELERANKIISSQSTEISDLEDTVALHEGTISYMNTKSRAFDEIAREMKFANDGYGAYNFYSSDTIIVVDKNETSRKFTLTANWPDGGTVDVEHSSNAAWVEFDSDEWETSVEMTVHPVEMGVTVATFSNDVDSNTFKVLIIVTE